MSKPFNRIASVIGMLLIFNLPSVFAKEGMWQPSKLKRQESNMRTLGLKMDVAQIYNEAGTGLNNAVVLFGKGCTASFVSDKGLLLTNHHCGYSYAQSLSSPEKNYLLSGFWAMSPKQELPCPGLTVTITRKLKNVTDYVLRDLSDTLEESIRNKQIQERISNLEKGYAKTERLDAKIKSFYNGNQYWVVLTQTYKDVRMVAFPPNGIGKFGADTDNWMWPRMTGDFSIFRVYADQKNQPAEYNPLNKPYKPEKYFPVATSGYKEGDFTMVYGFPYTSHEYLSSYQLGRIQQIIDPVRITLRKQKLAIWDDAMRSDPELFLKYAAKQSSLSNGYKKWQGELRGLEQNEVIKKKKDYEKEFEYAAASNTESPQDKMILTRIAAAVNGNTNALYAAEFIRESVLGVEAIQQAAVLDRLLNLYRGQSDQATIKSDFEKMKKEMNGFYKNYDAPTDQKVFVALLPVYLQQNPQIIAPELPQLLKNAGNTYEDWAAYVFGSSAITRQEKMNALLDAFHPQDTVLIKQDPAYQIYHIVKRFESEKVLPEMDNYAKTITPLNRIYMKRQMEYLNSGRDFYPDANQTLRLTYGQISSLDLPTSNIYQTTLNDLIPRHNASIEEFNIPEKLRTLYSSKDYGKWAVNGTVPVNFIASNHTSGGNSGSPVLNGKGQLIGINFDRAWQGTMSDLYYDPNSCRNISVDIRYVLFIIERFGNAGWLLKEMKLVK
jgi:hypothetical protein